MLFRKKSLLIESLLGKGTHFVGDLEFTNGLRLEGFVKGKLIAKDDPNMLIISSEGSIEGEIYADQIIISGTVFGPVHAKSFLELLPGARIIGNVSYTNIRIHCGAEITGELLSLKENAAPLLLDSPKHQVNG